MTCSFLLLSSLTGCTYKWWRWLWSLPCLVMRNRFNTGAAQGWYLWPLGAQLVACYECWAVKLWMFYTEPKDGNRAGVKTILCAVSRNDFSELLRWGRKQRLKWETKTDFKQQRFTVELKTDLRCHVHSVWALFILKYLSYITNVLITQVSALQASVVWGQPLCCGHCQSMLPPFFCASPTRLLVAAGYYFSFCLWAAEPVGARTES